MNTTKIEWVKNPDGTQGFTWNPITGCLNHTPEGLCLGGMFPCYAYKLANGRLKSRYLANANRAYRDDKLHHQVFDPFYPRFWPERIERFIDLSLQLDAGIFVCDMSDLFGIGIPREWQDEVFQAIDARPACRFYLLTKQPQNLIKFSPFPDNCWVGVTATDSEMLYWAMFYLGAIKASIKYLSLEPLLSCKPAKEWLLAPLESYISHSGINQVIIGAQTKPYKPPKIDWVQEIVEACDKAGIPVFLKDNLKPLLEGLDITGGSFGRLTELKSIEPKEEPRQRDWYQLRQEIPNV